MSYESALEKMVLPDERFIILTAENRAAIRNLLTKLGNRFIDAGIIEQGMVGAAAGLALRGRIPVVHALAAFLTMRSYEFVRTDVGLGKLPVKLVGSVAGFFSEANGPTHQAVEDVGLMANIPNLNLFCPVDEQDMEIGLPAVLHDPAPFYVRFNNLPPVTTHDTHFEIGKAETITPGDDVTILTYGLLFRQAFEAVSLLKTKGISVRLINLRTLKPLDENTVLDAARETRLLVTLEDHFISSGLFSILSQLLVRNRINARVLPLGLENRWFRPGMLADVLTVEGFTADQITEKIARRLRELFS